VQLQKQTLTTMRKILLFAALLLSFVSNAQITITNALFPVGGDTLSRSFTVNVASASVTPASGTAQNWDFSALSTDGNLFDSVRYASSGTSFSAFPNTEIILPFAGFGEGYADVTSTEVTIVGGSLNLTGIPLTAPFNDPQIVQTAPITYNTVVNDPFELQLAINIDSVPGLRPVIDTFLTQLPIPGLSADSLRFTVSGTTELNADAFGTCVMFDSTYDVIRQKVKIQSEIIIEIRLVSFIGAFWQDITSTVASQIPFPLNDTTFRYDFWTPSSKVPVVRMNMNTRGTIIEDIEFKGNNPTGITELSSLKDVELYPVPAQSTINLKADNLGVDKFNVQIIDAIGQSVYKQQNLTSGIHQLPVSELAQGTYWLTIRADNGKLLARKSLTISK
jgi:hypothetical protein